MPGLQAWDGSGRLIVDLGDFSTRFVTRVNILFPTTTQIMSFAVNGINGYNSFAAVTGSDVGLVASPDYACVTRQNAVDVIYLPTRNPLYNVNLYIEVFMFN